MTDKSKKEIGMGRRRVPIQSCTGYPKKSEEERKAENTRARFSDNPFRTGRETPEQLEWIRKRDEATRIFHETGDTTMAEEIGLFPKKSNKR